MSVQIDSHIKLKKPKGVAKAERERELAFKAYRNAYSQLNIRKPTHFTFDGKMVTIWIGPYKAVTASVRRIKELTRMMREKLRELYA